MSGTISDVYEKYDIFFVDVVGVMYDGINPYKDSVEAINSLPKEKEVIFLSNNPRPSSTSIKNIKNMGVDRKFSVVTSGDFTRFFLSNNFKNKKIYHLGSEKNKEITEGLEIIISNDIYESEAILLTAFFEEHEDCNRFDPILQCISKLDIPILCANPDIEALYGEKMRKCSGFLAEKVMSYGGKVTFLGKPNKSIYEYAENIFPNFAFDKRKILMIGDTLETDICGANAYGIDSLLVLSGITGINQKNKKDFDYSLSTYVSNRLNW